MNKNLPKKIPIFPLSGVVYFPKTNLPLNIFEERYLQLVNDAIKTDKMMGMIQSKRIDNEVYNIGCLGKISDYKKKEDGRIFINLTGITRFEVVKEIQSSKLYREFEVNYEKFSGDINEIKEILAPDLRKLLEKTKTFFNRNGLFINWIEFENLDHEQKINTIAMIAPI